MKRPEENNVVQKPRTNNAGSKSRRTTNSEAGGPDRRTTTCDLSPETKLEKSDRRQLKSSLTSRQVTVSKAKAVKTAEPQLAKLSSETKWNKEIARNRLTNSSAEEQRGPRGRSRGTQLTIERWSSQVGPPAAVGLPTKP